MAARALVLVMLAGSLAMWIGLPLGWVWLAGRLSADYPSIYLTALLGAPLSMVLLGVGLARINRTYLRLTGGLPAESGRASWLRSAGAERPAREPAPALEACMLLSVGLALVAFVVWFLFFAGSSLPNAQ